MTQLLVTIQVPPHPHLTPEESADNALLDAMRRLSGLRYHVEVVERPGDTDAAGEAMWAAGEMLLRHAGCEEKASTVAYAIGWLERAGQELGIEPAAPAEGGPAGE